MRLAWPGLPHPPHTLARSLQDGVKYWRERSMSVEATALTSIDISVSLPAAGMSHGDCATGRTTLKPGCMRGATFTSAAPPIVQRPIDTAAARTAAQVPRRVRLDAGVGSAAGASIHACSQVIRLSVCGGGSRRATRALWLCVAPFVASSPAWRSGSCSSHLRPAPGGRSCSAAAVLSTVMRRGAAQILFSMQFDINSERMYLPASLFGAGLAVLAAGLCSVRRTR